jgi:hypothetical protein
LRTCFASPFGLLAAAAARARFFVFFAAPAAEAGKNRQEGRSEAVGGISCSKRESCPQQAQTEYGSCAFAHFGNSPEHTSVVHSSHMQRRRIWGAR